LGGRGEDVAVLVGEHDSFGVGGEGGEEDGSVEEDLVDVETEGFVEPAGGDVAGGVGGFVGGPVQGFVGVGVPPDSFVLFAVP